MEYYQFNQKVEVVLLEIRIRLSIFIITGVCAGLPALVWSVRDLNHHRKNGHRISVFIILLLVSDVAELLLSSYILIKLLLDEIPCAMEWTCWVLGSLWLSSRNCGFLLNQLVALEGIISNTYPASVSSMSCLRNFCICVFLCITVGHVFSYIFDLIFMVFLFLATMIILWIISFEALCYPDHHSHTTRKSDRHILIVFIFSLLIYLPFVSLIFLFIFSISFSPVIFFLLLSLRLISDPLLCVLVCRQNLTLQTSQNPEGLV